MFNNRTKTFLLLTVTLIALIGLSAATAADIDNDAVDVSVSADDTVADASSASDSVKTSDVSSKSVEKNIKTVENVKSEGEANFTELENDIQASDVTLGKNYVQADGESAIVIAENKTIDGAGYTITSHKGVFTVNNGVTFTLKNAIIITADYPTSSSQAVYDINNKGSVILDNVTFNYMGTGRNEGPVMYGSPVGGDGNYANFTVIGCTFDGYDTPRACIYAYGLDTNVTVDNSLFTHYNTGNAAIYLYKARSNLTVTNSNFTDAGCEEYFAISYAGAIYGYNYQQNIFIDNCLFDNITSDYRGAAMYVSGNTTVKNSKFTNLKQAKPLYNGGAIWVNNANGILTLENNVMEDIVSNSADIYFNNGKLNSSLNVVGESITADQEASVTLELNVTDVDGNSVDFRVNPFTVKINGETITTTYANGTISSTFDASYDPEVYPIVIDYNDANILGDVTLPNINLTVVDIGLLNYADVQDLIDSARMGATVSINGPVYRGSSEESIVINKFVNLDFKGNTIVAKGGRVFEINDTVTTIKNVSITGVDNKSPSAYNVQGRIANVTNGGIVTFDHVEFVNNKAPSQGSSNTGSFILVFNDSYVELYDCHIDNCTGTFINNVNETVVIEDTFFTNNKLGSSFNALIANGGDLVISDSFFFNNTVNIATIRGQSDGLPYAAYGGYYTSYNRPLTVTGTWFIDNYAGSGRGAAINSNDDATIVDCAFVNNRINQYSNKGGAIFSEEGDLNIDGCLFVNNSARYYESYSGTITANNGTAIYNAEGGMNITNSIFLTNITIANVVYNDAENAIVVANGNYWGTNEPEGMWASGASADNITVDNWVIFNVTATPSENVKFMDNITVRATLNQITDGTTVSDYDGKLPDYYHVTFETEEGILEDTEVRMVDGVAETNMTVKLSPFEITASYPNEEVEFVGEAAMPEPQVYVLNDGNWTKFFDEETGDINEDLVVPYSELRFEGAFANRDMFINIPVNLTTADTQGVLNNCTITVLSKDVIITNLEMESRDYADVLIELYEASDVEIKNNTLLIVNTEEDQITRAIEITGGENNIISDNNILTVGPEQDIIYESDGSIKLIYTTSIEAIGSDDLRIENNYIFTRSNYLEATDSGTIYGVYVTGSSRDERVEDVYIINNTIETVADVYAYGVTVNRAEEAIIGLNGIYTSSDVYAAGIQTYYVYGSEILDNTIECSAYNLTYGIFVNGEVDYDTYYTYPSDYNSVSNNTIVLDSDNAWGIETFVTLSNAITYNRIIIIADYCVGVGLADSNGTDVSYNNISLTASMEGEPDTHDAIPVFPAGVKVVSSSWSYPNYNGIAFNNIFVDAPVATVPAVNLTTNYNEVFENYLVSPKGLGDAAVVKTGFGNTIEDNTPLIYVITNDTYAYYFDEEGVFNNSLAENGSYLTVSGEIDNKDFIFDNCEYVLVNDGTAVLYNATIITQNDAKMVFDGLVIDNMDQRAVYFESEENELKNSEITVTADDKLFAVEIAGDGNIISNVTIVANIPSADVEYNPDWSTKVPGPAALLITSSNNLVVNSLILMNSTDSVGYSPTTDGIYILSLGDTISNNTIFDTNVTVMGSNYVYGINVGNAKDTTLDGIEVTVLSRYYGDAVQLFDADGIEIVGELNVFAIQEGYGIYSSAMGVGISKEIFVYDSEINVISNNANGILIEGSNDTFIVDTTFDITGENASAIKVNYIYWIPGNVPSNIEVSDCDIKVTTTGDENVLFFGLCDDVLIVDNTIKTEGGNVIFLNSTTNAVVTDNYIMIDDVFIGNYGVFSTEDDSVIENNTPVSPIIEDLIDEIEELTGPQNTTVEIDEIATVGYSDSVTITGKVVDQKGNYIPDQTVNVTVNGESVTLETENGVFTYEGSATTLGVNNVTVSYPATEEYYESSAEATFNVTKQQTTVTVDKISTLTYKDDVTISGKVLQANGNPVSKATVKISINGKAVNVTTDSKGVFNYTTQTTAVGKNNVTVSYAGNKYYDSSSATSSFTVNKLGSVITLDSIKSVAYKDEVVISGTLVNARGVAFKNTAISLKINGKTVTVKTDSNGVFNYTTKASAIGKNNVTVTYAGNSKLKAATAKTTFTVTKLGSVLTLNSISDAAYNEDVVISGTLINDHGVAFDNTEVQININGKIVKVMTKNGVFTYTTKAKNIGLNNITVTYAGNSKLKGSSQSTTFSVSKQKTEITIDPISSVVKGKNVTITGTYKDVKGNAVKNATMKVYINGKKVTAKTDNDGKFKVSRKTDTVGTNNVQVSYGGSSKVEGASADTTFKVTKS